MALAMSTYLEGLVMGWLRGSNFPAAPSSLKLALSSTAPTDDGNNVTEPGDPGYARQTFTLSDPVTTEVDGTMSSNVAGILFTGSALGSVTHGAVFDNAGNMLFYGAFDVSRVIVNNDSVSLATTVLRITLTGLYSKYLAEAIMEWLRGTAMPSAPTSLMLGLSSANPLRDKTGLTEPPGGDGYTRRTVGLKTPTVVVGTGTSTKNNADIIFGPSVNNGWGSISHWALLDSSSNLLLYGPLAVPKTISLGAGFGIAEDNFSFTVR